MKFPESKLAHQYCVGNGLEIGGSAHNPFGLDTVNIDITDSMDTVYKMMEMELCGEMLPVDFVAPGDDIPVVDESFDFVVSSHVLEHFVNPIKAIVEWFRIIRPGGTIFMIVPHRDRTFDSERERTPLSHIIGDYITGRSEPHETEQHEHVWITQDIVDLVYYLQTFIPNMVLECFEDVDDKVGNGFTIILSKEVHYEN
jgi:ubiquinone/menaquinone biosynthesis C-methylase UbiE